MTRNRWLRALLSLALGAVSLITDSSPLGRLQGRSCAESLPPMDFGVGHRTHESLKLQELCCTGRILSEGVREGEGIAERQVRRLVITLDGPSLIQNEVSHPGLRWCVGCGGRRECLGGRFHLGESGTQASAATYHVTGVEQTVFKFLMSAEGPRPSSG